MTAPHNLVLALDEKWITLVRTPSAETIHNRSTGRTAVLLRVAVSECLVSIDALAVIPKLTNAYYY